MDQTKGMCDGTYLSEHQLFNLGFFNNALEVRKLSGKEQQTYLQMMNSGLRECLFIETTSYMFRLCQAILNMRMTYKKENIENRRNIFVYPRFYLVNKNIGSDRQLLVSMYIR